MDEQKEPVVETELFAIADNFIAVAKGELDAKDLEDRTTLNSKQ